MAQKQNDPKFTQLDAALRPTSQPMSKATASWGAEALAKDGNSAETPSPYGTRSRNRTGNSRPNYAEDKDMDLEFDYLPSKKAGEPKKSTRQSNVSTATATAQEGQRSNGSARKSTSTDEVKNVTTQSAPKEPSLASQAPAVPAVNGLVVSQPSKKRKAASQSGNGGGQQQGSTQATTVTAAATAAAAATVSSSVSVSASKRLAAQASQNPSGYAETNMLSFDSCRSMPKDGKMVADDGTVLAPNDHVYLVCEPPGEPYYIGRIMEFLHVGNDSSKPVDALRINWYYRPKDIGRRVQDTRLLFATMHSDISPLTALRGKCQIRHKTEIKNMDQYRKTPDCFWYEKLYDRYIQKNYDLIPTATIINVPEKVKKVLDERWKFVLVEQGRGKELTSAIKLCKKCAGYCASNDSVDCSDCKLTYHMNCVTPPVTKKPSRGFGWSCAACSRKHERKLHARNTPNLLENEMDLDDEEFNEEDDDVVLTGRTSPSNEKEDQPSQGTPEQIYQASLWPYRYLGQHCKVEDALDYDDRIYPRASSRIGPKHQATVLPWPGRPVKYEPALEIKKAGKKDPKPSKEAQAALEAEKARREKRPKWVQDEPAGYVARGEDHDNDDPNCTATLLWKPPAPDMISAEDVKGYVKDAMAMAGPMALPEASTNLQDNAMVMLYHSGFDTRRALKLLREMDKVEFKEPDFSPAEQKKFEDAIVKYGSELHLVSKQMRSANVKHGDVVRHYYIWKKTERGKKIWGDYSGRKGKKEAKKTEEASKTQDEVAHDHDDSAFDAEKAHDKKRGFVCTFCSTKSSRQWRRAPNSSSAHLEGGGKGSNKNNKEQNIPALCRRCAELWRRYAIQWEDIEEVVKKVAQAGGRAWKRKQDEELLKELISAKELMGTSQLDTPDSGADSSTPGATAAATNGTSNGEPPRKKLKGAADDRNGTESSASGATKKKDKGSEKSTPAPAVEMPRPRTLPCAICGQVEPLGDQHLSCRECRLAVHKNCYGVVDSRASAKPGKWVCDTCANDRSPQVSINYKCVLCPVEHTKHDFVEPPKVATHKKKTDKERERERVEREQAQKAAEYYQKKQEEMNRPANPREPLKRTADNNWVHVTCAVWTPEVKFGSGEALVPAEGTTSIPRARFEETCVVCNKSNGACVSCHQCRTPVHVECARQKGFLLGFDITPVKGSRRDQFNIVTINGESGVMSAAIWCKEHVPTKTIVHRMEDVVGESGLNALQLYVQNFKQADRSMTDTVRKANLVTAAAKGIGTPAAAAAAAAAATGVLRRASTITTTMLPINAVNGHDSEAADVDVDAVGAKVCITCGTDSSPKWWTLGESPENELANGHSNSLGAEARRFVDQRKFQCHKCHKTNRKPKPLRESPPPVQAPTPTPAPPVLPPEPARVMPTPAPTPASAPAPVPVAHQPSPSAHSVQSTGPPPPLTSPPPRQAEARYPWSASGGATPPGPPPQHGGPLVAPPIAPPTMAAPPVQAPPHLSQQLAGPPGPPGPTSIPPMRSYPPPTAPYSDWHSRPPSQHGPPPRQVNGDPAGHHSPLSTLSALRPPPLSAPPGPPQLPPSHRDTHLGQPLMNGLPPSPRRMNGPPLPSNNPYMHPYHSPHHASPPHVTHGLPNGGPPPPGARGPDHLSQGLLSQRAPFSPHVSPPVSRDGPSPLSSAGPPPPRPPENRPPSGASASPSLRNLLI